MKPQCKEQFQLHHHLPPPPVTPPPALAAAPAVAEHVAASAQLTEPGPATTYAEQLTVQQLLHIPQEV